VRAGVVGAFRRGKSALVAALPPIEAIEIVELPGYGGLDAPPIEDHAALQAALIASDLYIFVFRVALLPMRADEFVLNQIKETGKPVFFVQSDQGELQEWAELTDTATLHTTQEMAQTLANLNRDDFQQTASRHRYAEINAMFQESYERLDEIYQFRISALTDDERLRRQFLEWFRVVMARRVNSSPPHELTGKNAVPIIHTLLNETALNVLNEFKTSFDRYFPTEQMPTSPEFPKPPGMIAIRVQDKGSEVAAFVAQATRLAEQYQPAVAQVLQEYGRQVRAQLDLEIEAENARLRELEQRWRSMVG
jgi:hypothetical protein